jgi:hypothetical protein
MFFTTQGGCEKCQNFSHEEVHIWIMKWVVIFSYEYNRSDWFVMETIAGTMDLFPCCLITYFDRFYLVINSILGEMFPDFPSDIWDMRFSQ